MQESHGAKKTLVLQLCLQGLGASRAEYRKCPRRPAWAPVPPQSGEKLPEESRWPWSPVVGSGSALREETRGAALSALSQRTQQAPRAAAVEGPGPGAYGGPAARRSALGAPAARPAAAPGSSVLAHTRPRRDPGGCRAPAPFPEGWRRPHPPLCALPAPFSFSGGGEGRRPVHLERDDSTDLGPERRVSRPGAGWFTQEEEPRSGLCLGLPGLVQSRAASLSGRADPG
ncbi:skin secretory protein xP2-like isoform X2 [Moschus berezovskii]|uniref:skin secretory protein xP2-like isoform X2 n=1 Tax=Moschus berezovskii TaxID=68408 RepID=UPI0024440E54|nr:skin secretory protein xP2-like isoform X2 [Moschus berezovskii]